MHPTTAQAEEIRKRLQKELLTLDVDTFLMLNLLETTPYVLKTPELCIEWKVRLAKALQIDPYSILIVGSACTGISLSPFKDYRAFSADSDVDIGIVSAFHFELAWKFLRDAGTVRYKMSAPARNALDDQRQTHVFWGCIATDQILEHLPFGREWTLALAEMAKHKPTEHRDLKVRLYRDAHSLVSYHRAGVTKLRHRLLETTHATG